ncbi:MAG: hypothetical protein LRY73_20305 [Bacillus sp. (in: Bacteria)]|nr:hypothetical protein [Bacillus sp. (in: firmicutes)]
MHKGIRNGKLLLLALVLLLSACAASDATLTQASRELSFQILVPNNLPDNWEFAGIVYEEELLVLSYLTDTEDRMELVQDRSIQGLNVAVLREYLLTGNRSPVLPEEVEIKEMNGFIGELIFFEQPEPIVQYTFVKKQELIGSVERVPTYQVIGKGASFEELEQFVDTLVNY